MIRINSTISSKQKASVILKLFVFLLSSSLLFACGDTPKQKEKKEQPDKTSVYYPINTYIKQQIKDVDTTPYYLYRITIIDSVKDSSVINRATFDEQVKKFLLPQLEEKSFKNTFTESVFEDQSTNSITLTYLPKSKDNLVQSASVLLNKDDQQVKYIFINTLDNYNDSTVIQRIGWKGGKSCYLNKYITYPDKKSSSQQLSFVWNDKPDE